MKQFLGQMQRMVTSKLLKAEKGVVSELTFEVRYAGRETNVALTSAKPLSGFNDEIHGPYEAWLERVLEEVRDEVVADVLKKGKSTVRVRFRCYDWPYLPADAPRENDYEWKVIR